jgi:hypothetical protein
MIHNFSLVESSASKFKIINLDGKTEIIDNICTHFGIAEDIVVEALNFVTNFEDAWI